MNLPSNSYSELLSSSGDGGALILAETALRTGGHRREGVALAAELGLHHTIRSPQLWDAVLQRMVRLDMGAELAALLVELNTHPQVQC